MAELHLDTRVIGRFPESSPEALACSSAPRLHNARLRDSFGGEERFLDWAGRRVRPGEARGTQTARRGERGRRKSACFARNDGGEWGGFYVGAKAPTPKGGRRIPLGTPSDTSYIPLAANPSEGPPVAPRIIIASQTVPVEES